MTGCSAKGCRNSTVKGFVMKRFPRDPARRSAWASNVKREGWEPTNASCLCEVHFDDSQWEDQDWGGTPKLKRTAVPTVFCKCSYGKKRGRLSGSVKTANKTVMTEHSYGSTQGSENNLVTVHSKGKFDRRYDHQYAILGDEEGQAKGEVKKVKVEVRRDCHDEFCPVYNTPKRRALLMKKSMDKNNNGEKKISNPRPTDSGFPEEPFHCKIAEGVEINHVNGELALIQVSDPLAIEAPTQGELLTSFSTTTNVQPPQEGFLTSFSNSFKVETPPDGNMASLNSPHQVQQTSPGELSSCPQLVKLVLLPEEPKVKEEPDIKLHYNIPEVEQPCAISRVQDDSIPNEQLVEDGSPIKTKDHTTKNGEISDNVEKGSDFAASASRPKECRCESKDVSLSKVRTAEKVLARQGRLVKRVAALQRQLTRQKHTHEIEIEKLMKRFHELEEKFDLTRSILRSCIGDDQFTVYATQNAKGVIWSKNTIEKAMQLRKCCGASGYNAVSKLLIPLPSDRTLRRFTQKTKPQDGIYVEIRKDTSDV